MEKDNINNDTFFCNIAELITEIPTARGLASRCKDYMCQKTGTPDIVIKKEQFKYSKYAELTEEQMNYLEAGWIFYRKLLNHNGFYLHSSAIELGGRAYLFSGTSGIGKSTHTRMWQHVFGDDAQVFNDDKPALRKIDGKWYAFGTPFCGKDYININKKVPLGAICFLKQAEHNKIRRLTSAEAVQKIFTQTFYRFYIPERLDTMAKLVGDIVQTIPVFELENRPDEAAARLSYTTMESAAKEAGL